MSPVRFHLLLALSLAAALTVALWWLLGGGHTWPRWIVAWLGAASMVAFGYYGWDKVRSGRGGRRTPEVVLHLLSAVGGSPGAYAGMQVFRHKTIKGPFRVVFWGIVVLQALLLIWLVKITWWA